MHYEQSRILQPEEAPDVGAKIRLGPPRIVMAAPLGDTSWGSFNFPNIWRLRDGRLVCLAPNDTDAEGHFEITVPVNTRCMGYGSMRVILPSANRATSYCHVEPREGDVTLSLDEPITLFETTPAEVLPPYGDPSMARTVAFEGGLEVEVVPDQLGFTFDEAKYNRLAGAQVDPSDPSLCFLTEPVDGLWAFSPEVNATAPFVFRFPNAQGYDAGAAVDLFVLGGLDTTLPDGSSITETEWLRYGTALVSADGTIIEGNSRTNGLPALNWLGYRLAE